MNAILPPPEAAGGGDSGMDFRFRETGGKIPPIRGDLKITPVTFRGRSAYVVKDPASLKYFRWGEKEFCLSSLLDGKRTGPEILKSMQRAFPEDDYDAQDLEAAIGQFLSAGLLLTDGTLAQQIHHRQRDLLKKAKRSKLWLTVPGKLISFKITLFDPDLLLLRMSKRLAFLWTWQSTAVLLAMMAFSGWLLTRDTGNLAGRMPDLLGWQNLLIIWVVMILVKVVHEFGHGLSCKHFGGEVHEMGAMFILFSPFLFCNATDSWTFKEKWKRIVVNFGGIYLELFLAAVAAALWVLTPLGIFNQICFNVMLVCSVMTIFFNINPLMKFDGYYALSDWLEVPNLKERGDKALVSRVAGFFTGGEGIAYDPIVERFKWPILTYAVASYAWTFLIAYNILRAIGFMLEPYGLDRLVQSASGFVLIVGILAPPFLVAMQIMKIIKTDETRAILRRVVIVSASLAVILIALLFLPMPVNVKTACVIDAPNKIRVTASTPGFLSEILVRDGSRVSQGDPLVLLTNPELEKNLHQLRLQEESVLASEAEAVSRQMDARIPALRALASQYGLAVAKYSADLEKLRIAAPSSGTVIAKGLRDQKGTFLREGSPICEILPEGPLEVVLALSEKQAGIVRAGQTASFRIHSLPGEEWSGTVRSVSSSPSIELPHQSLGQHAGGTVPAILSSSNSISQSDNTPVALPSGQVYKARIAIEDPDGTLRPGMGGRLRIQTGSKPLGVCLLDALFNMLRSDFRL
jgi:putative peptide zinc metalloprotease protein